jgi:capsular polysaccharide biosynthesis protein
LESGSYEDTFYYPWLTSEYVVNGLADWVQSGSFALAVSERLEDGPSAAELAGRFAAQNARSVLVLHISWGDSEALAEIAGAAIETLRDDNAHAFPQFDAAPAEIVAWDGVRIAPVPTPLSSRIQPFFRAALGLAAGLGLAFLFEYLDPALHTREDLEALGCDVVGEIPRH